MQRKLDFISGKKALYTYTYLPFFGMRTILTLCCSVYAEALPLSEVSNRAKLGFIFRISINTKTYVTKPNERIVADPYFRYSFSFPSILMDMLASAPTWDSSKFKTPQLCPNAQHFQAENGN